MGDSEKVEGEVARTLEAMRQVLANDLVSFNPHDYFLHFIDLADFSD